MLLSYASCGSNCSYDVGFGRNINVLSPIALRPSAKARKVRSRSSSATNLVVLLFCTQFVFKEQYTQFVYNVNREQIFY